MHLRVSNEMAQKFPDLRISFIAVRGMDNTGDSPELQAELRAAEADFRARVPDLAALAADPRIAAWQEAYQRFGVNPKKARPSAEALLRRVVNGNPVPWINKAVNAYLLAELFYLLPVGGYTLDRLQGDLQLRLSPGDEPFTPIGGAEAEQTSAGEVVYADDARVLTRRWNFRDCDHAKVEASSRDIILFVEAPSPTVTTEDLRGLVTLIGEKTQKHCGGHITLGLLDVREATEVELPTK
ncbi:B3/B4 domain-containing protein [Myxococcus stipitatus]|uniref:B3/B4 domain-containing protein n=1 Tax=Myxococcus stipitatus TaxID=83455 RepID=UPI0030D51EE8